MPLVVLIAGVCIALALWWVRSNTDQAQPGTTVAIAATPAPQLDATPIEWIPVAQPIKARAPAAKRALKLPVAVQVDEAQHVLDAARVAPSEQAQTVTSVLDTATGETHTYVVAEPMPWLAVRQRGDAGAYIGLKQGAPTLRLLARHEVVQIKGGHVGALASVDVPINGSQADPDVFVGVGVSITWP